MLKDAETSTAARKKVEPTVRGIVAEGTRNGFVARDPSMPVDGTSTLAAPIFAEDRILGTIGLTYFLSAMDRDEVLHRAAAPLMEAARAIGKSAERLIGQRRSLEARHFAVRGPADILRPRAKRGRRASQKN